MNQENEKLSAQGGSRIRDLGSLPRELAPQRDLWPGIAAQIGGSGLSAGGDDRMRADQQQRVRSSLRWTVPLAAGLAALAIGVLLGRWSAPPPGSLQARSTNNSYAASATLFDAAFVADRDQLRNRVMTRIRELPAEQRDQLLASVVSLQRAVEEIQRALGADPANALLQELLVGACQQEMTQLNDINLATKAESRL